MVKGGDEFKHENDECPLSEIFWLPTSQIVMPFEKKLTRDSHPDILAMGMNLRLKRLVAL